nr:hypothetical protein GCM10025732_15950 [Glycomyces mayteni]
MLDGPVEDRLGAQGDLQVGVDGGEDVPGHVDDGEAGVGGAEVGAEDDAGGGVEREGGGGLPPVEAVSPEGR